MSLEGWVPQIGEFLTLAEVVEFAFDYRGNTTIVRTDGTEVVGYIFNRDSTAPEPFIQYFDEAGDGPFALPYREIATIKMAETLVDLRRSTGLAPSRKGYFRSRPPARRVGELMRFYRPDDAGAQE